MSSARDTYKYHLKIGNKIVHRGVTSDLVRREHELKKRWPSGKIYQIGAKSTRNKALEWEKNGGKSTR